MKAIIFIGTLSLLLTYQGICQSQNSSQKNKILTIPEKSIQIKELGIIISLTNDSIFTMVIREEVDTIPNDQKVKSGYKLSKINGVEISDFKIIEEIYESTKVGQQIEFEFRKSNGNYLKKTITKGTMLNLKTSNSTNIGMLVGIFIETNDSDKEVNIVDVSNLLMPKAFLNHEISKGDKILRINNTTIRTSQEAFEEIGKVGILEKFTMTFLKNNKEITIEAEMPEPPQGNEVKY